MRRKPISLQDPRDRTDYSALLEHGRCACCGELAPSGKGTIIPWVKVHAERHLAKVEAMVLIANGRHRIIPSAQWPMTKASIGYEGSPEQQRAAARRKIAKDYAAKHRGVRMPKGFREWKP